MILSGKSPPSHAPALKMAVIILSIWTFDAFAFSPLSLTRATFTGSHANNCKCGPIHEHHGKQPDYNNAGSCKSMSSLSSSVSSVHEDPLPKLDRVLSKLTSLFPLFVLGSALLGEFIVIKPHNYVLYISQISHLSSTDPFTISN